MHSAQPLATHPAPAARRLSCTYSQPCTLSVASRALAIPRGLRRPNLALDRCKISTSQLQRMPHSSRHGRSAPQAQHQTQDALLNHQLQCLATSGPLARDQMGVLSRASKLPIMSITSLQGVFSQQPARPGQPRIMAAVSRAKLLHRRPFASRAT
jgi:hypothetical protein